MVKEEWKSFYALMIMITKRPSSCFREHEVLQVGITGVPTKKMLNHQRLKTVITDLKKSMPLYVSGETLQFKN